MIGDVGENVGYHGFENIGQVRLDLLDLYFYMTNK